MGLHVLRKLQRSSCEVVSLFPLLSGSGVEVRSQILTEPSRTLFSGLSFEIVSSCDLDGTCHLPALAFQRLGSQVCAPTPAQGSVSLLERGSPCAAQAGLGLTQRSAFLCWGDRCGQPSHCGLLVRRSWKTARKAWPSCARPLHPPAPTDLTLGWWHFRFPLPAGAEAREAPSQEPLEPAEGSQPLELPSATLAHPELGHYGWVVFRLL